MQKNIRPMIVIGVLGFSVLLGGCSTFVAKQADVATETPNVTQTGKMISGGSTGFSLVTGKETIELDSRKVDLKLYVDKMVEVTGQYSGTTLFVDSAK